MRRPLSILIVLILLGLLAYWLVLRPTPEVEESHVATDDEAAISYRATQMPDSVTVPVSAAQDPSGARLRRAYIMSLNQGALKLLEAQDIEGDFATRKQHGEEWSGMLRCRLLSAANEVLAEELLPAPDHLCAVLDARSGSTTQPVSYTVPGEVVFQVRLPRVRAAARLEVFRILTPGALAQESLIGSLKLTSS